MTKKYLVLQIEKEKRGKWSQKFLTTKSILDDKIYDKITDIFFYEDIYQYTTTEYFIDITNYQELYKKSTYQLALDIKNKLTSKYPIVIKIGIGTNLFLAKTACDIITKIQKTTIAYLDEKEYISTCSTHQPLSDFWQISNSMMLKLKKLGINTMEDIRNYSYKKLYEVFGYNAEYLINHSLGIEGATIKELQKETPPRAISSCLTLKPIKTRKESIKELQKLLDLNILKLRENSLSAKTIHLYIKYANNIIPRQIIPIKLTKATSSYPVLMNLTLQTFNDNANLFFPIEKLAISFGEIIKIDMDIQSLPTKKKKIKFIWQNIFYQKKNSSLSKSNKMTFLHT